LLHYFHSSRKAYLFVDAKISLIIFLFKFDDELSVERVRLFLECTVLYSEIFMLFSRVYEKTSSLEALCTRDVLELLLFDLLLLRLRIRLALPFLDIVRYRVT